MTKEEIENILIELCIKMDILEKMVRDISIKKELFDTDKPRLNKVFDKIRKNI